MIGILIEILKGFYPTDSLVLLKNFTLHYLGQAFREWMKLSDI